MPKTETTSTSEFGIVIVRYITMIVIASMTHNGKHGQVVSHGHMVADIDCTGTQKTH